MKKKFKTYFIQDWGTYPQETLVVVGYGKGEIDKVLKQARTSKEILQEIKESECVDYMDDSLGLMKDFSNGASLLWLRDFYPRRWKTWDTLMHECHHLVERCLKENRGMEEEIEALAYQQEYLVRSIRDKLLDRYGKYTKRK